MNGGSCQSPEVERMVTEPLRALFASTHAQNTKRKVKVQLRMTPKSAKFGMFICNPCLDKQFYHDNPDIGLGCAGNIFYGAGLLGIFSAYQ